MLHPWHDVTPGHSLPLEFNALVEIPMGSSNKYELDKKTGLLRLDRVLYLPFTTRPTTGSSRKLMPRMMTRWMFWFCARNPSTP